MIFRDITLGNTIEVRVYKDSGTFPEGKEVVTQKILCIFPTIAVWGHLVGQKIDRTMRKHLILLRLFLSGVLIIYYREFSGNSSF